MPEDQNLRSRNLYLFPALVGSNASNQHHALIRFRTGRPNLEDLALHLENVTGPRRAGPRDFAADADDAVGERQSAGAEQTHGHRGRVPPACCQSRENGGAGGRFIQVKRLRVELGGKRFHSFRGHFVFAGRESLSGVQIFEIK